MVARCNIILVGDSQYNIANRPISICSYLWRFVMVKYPPKLESDVVLLIIDIVRQGQILERKAEFGEAVWNVQGVLQGIFLGIPGDDPQPVGAILFSDSELDSLKQLHASLSDLIEDGLPAGTEKDDLKFSPAIIMALVRMIALILDFYWK